MLPVCRCFGMPVTYIELLDVGGICRKHIGDPDAGCDSCGHEFNCHMEQEILRAMRDSIATLAATELRSIGKALLSINGLYNGSIWSDASTSSSYLVHNLYLGTDGIVYITFSDYEGDLVGPRVSAWSEFHSSCTYEYGFNKEERATLTKCKAALGDLGIKFGRD